MKRPPLRIPTLLASVIAGLCLAAGVARADAPLKSTLGLDLDQAAKVQAIQRQAFKELQPVRGELHREERALRRAHVENDSAAVARQEKLIVPLREKLAEIFASEEKQIRAVLTPEQTVKYEAWLKVRNEMVGSSRDVQKIKAPAKAAE